jgi:hypothetical protein
MPKNLDDDEVAKASTIFRTRMLRTALRKIDIDARTFTVARRDGILADHDAELAADVPIEALTNSSHPDRLDVPLGPMLFYRNPSGGTACSVINLSGFLFSTSRDLRSGVLAAIDFWTASDPLAITAKTRAVLTAERAGLITDDERAWRNSAIRISDALNDDLLCALAGLRQALKTQFAVAAENYAAKVLWPTPSSLDSIDLHFWQPSVQRDAIERELTSLDKTEMPRAVFRKYYDRFGHIPLDRSLGLATAIQAAIPDVSLRHQAWNEIWGAVDEIRSPFARYHAILLFIALPGLIPEDKKSPFWEEVADFASASATAEHQNGLAPPLLRRSALARHYLCHLANHLPGVNSERLSVFSWWIADRVEGVIELGGNLANELTDTIVQPAI